MRRLESWLYVAWLNVNLRYRRTSIGPLWLLVGPALFIAVLGVLFSRISDVETAVFIPHLTIGLVVWTLISGFVSGSPNVFHRSRLQLMQTSMSLIDLVIVEVFSTLLNFLHQVIIIVAVFLILGVAVGIYALVSLIGLALLVANGIWLTMVFGIIGARYRDLSEVVHSVMRIAFLATPIIWMPGKDDRVGQLDAYLTLNPFYHFLELIRAPLLSNPISPLSWLVVVSITVAGSALAYLFYQRFRRQVPLWV